MSYIIYNLLFNLWSYEPKDITIDNWMNTVYIDVEEYWSFTSPIVFLSCFAVGLLVWVITRSYYIHERKQIVHIPTESMSYSDAEKTTSSIQSFLYRRRMELENDVDFVSPSTWLNKDPHLVKYCSPHAEAFPLLNFVQTCHNLGCDIIIAEHGRGKYIISSLRSSECYDSHLLPFS